MAEPPLAAEVPRIRRARGFRLYDAAGRRYLDLWQAGGEAILGHRPARAAAAVKAALDRGLAAAVPTAWEARLLAALAARFPAYRTFRLYASRDRALEAAARVLGVAPSVAEVADPALELDAAGQAGEIGLWRPFLGCDPPWRVVLPVLPFTLGGSPAAAGFRDLLPADVEPSDFVSAAAAVAALRGLAGVTDARTPDPFGPRDLAECPCWRRRGPYVRPVFDAGAYPGVFREFLRRGVLLSPYWREPSILPGEASRGERDLVVELFHSIPRG